MSEERDKLLFAKLETVKEIRSKVMAVERLRGKLASEVEVVQSEEASLAEYRAEMELLLQEKMAHVEELRQIHADINAMESIIKAAEETRTKSLDHARRVYDEYIPLKKEVGRVVAHQFGHDLTLPNLTPEDDPIPPSFFEKSGVEWPMEQDDLCCVAGGHSMASLGGLGVSPTYLGVGQNNLMGVPIRAQAHKVDQRPLPPAPGPPAPSFRQQPPPMKSCLSCHQQIHRNAPICPLCKAKSRSRNPKKPKKKD